MDVSCRLRKLCCKGHMSSMLFKKEIGQVYELLKCNFSDGDLSSITRSEDEWNPGNSCQAKILSMLVEGQNHLIEFYEMVLAQLWEDGELSALCKDHLGHLKELNKMLNMENNLVQKNPPHDEQYGIVA